MLFNSISFLLFFPIVFAAYWLAPQRARRALLLVASYVFYMNWIPVYGVLIALLTVLNYYLGLALDKSTKHKKAILIATLILNLGALGYYKYTPFFCELVKDGSTLIEQLTGLKLTTANFTGPEVLLPLGISFFVFEFVHYIVDIYRGSKPIKNLLDFSLFAAFFPSQIAGPIKRFQDFMEQVSQPIYWDQSKFMLGLRLFLQGLFKKVALGDNVGLIVNAGYLPAVQMGTMDAWIAMFGFAWQVYFDFSGYTDMGRGCAFMLGIRLPDNFNLPYLGHSLIEYWRRWHISLSTWLRDYLYIPLGGRYNNKARNLFITMVLGGLWHGAAMHYVIWGALQGIALGINHKYNDIAARSETLKKMHSHWLSQPICIAFTFFVVSALLVVFRAPTTTAAIGVLATCFSWMPSDALLVAFSRSTLPVSLTLYSIYAMCSSTAGRAVLGSMKIDRLYASIPTLARVPLYTAVALATFGFAPQQPSPFIYFQF